MKIKKITDYEAPQVFWEGLEIQASLCEASANGETFIVDDDYPIF